MCCQTLQRCNAVTRHKRTDTFVVQLRDILRAIVFSRFDGKEQHVLAGNLELLHIPRIRQQKADIEVFIRAAVNSSDVADNMFYLTDFHVKPNQTLSNNKKSGSAAFLD